MLWCESLWLVFGLVSTYILWTVFKMPWFEIETCDDQVKARLQEMIALTRSPTQLCLRDLISHEWCHVIINVCNSIVANLYKGNCCIALFNWVIIVFMVLHILPFVPVCTSAQQNQPILNSHQQTVQLSRRYFVWSRCVTVWCNLKLQVWWFSWKHNRFFK